MARADQSGDWRGRLAPSLKEIESLAIEAWAKLPQSLHGLCSDLTIKLVDFPDEQLIENLGLESPFDVLGFFEGSGLGEVFSLPPEQASHQLFLFRRPILDDWAEHEETLGDIITHILIREIGDHFGLSDREMEEIESNIEH